jgi:hypothetical protein
MIFIFSLLQRASIRVALKILYVYLKKKGSEIGGGFCVLAVPSPSVLFIFRRKRHLLSVMFLLYLS